MISADVKTYVQQQEIKEVVAITFYKKYLQNLKYNVKQACIFHLILSGITSNLLLSVKNSWCGGRVYLTDKIC